MPIWLKLKVFAPKDNISNVGTKYQTIDGRRQIVNPEGSDPFQIKKGEFTPIPYDWRDLDKVKEKFDPEIFDFFKTKKEVIAKLKKEAKLLAMLPIKKLAERRKRIQEKVDKAKFGQKRPTMDDVIKEAKKIGADIPLGIQ